MIVTTVNATYRIDRHDRTLTRLDATHPLPGDGQPLTLLGLEPVVVGRSMLAYIEVDGRPKLRATSEVLAVVEP